MKTKKTNIIAIDSGNKNVKTEHFSFPSALGKTQIASEFNANTLYYNGTYYTINEDKRVRHLEDKSQSEDFYVLALFGIAKEIELRVEQGKFPKEQRVFKITYLDGLPPADWYLKDKFTNYFKQNRDAHFTYHEKEYHIIFEDVYIFPQAYAVCGLKPEIYKKKNFLIVDIGGWTVDYMTLHNGELDMSQCDSLEEGIITFYNEVTSNVRKVLRIRIRESYIDEIIKGDFENDIFDDETYAKIVEIIDNTAHAYCEHIVAILKEEISYFNSTPMVLCGGGAVLLKNYFEKHLDLERADLIDNVCMNAIGYRKLFRLLRLQKSE